MEKGKLYLVATPIGNLKDITLRALEILKDVDLIAAEDTRQTLKLLNHFNIKKSLISYHKYNEKVQSEFLIEKINKGEKIALVSDAGMPGISDPGSTIILKCIEREIDFEVLPGATAVITGLIYSGLDTTKFIFRGFLPRDNKDKKIIIENLKNRTETLIFYEAPHRLLKTLQFLKDNLGNRKVSICKELTKLHEQILRLTLEEAINYYKNNKIKGEYVIVLEGKNIKDIEKEQEQRWKEFNIEEHILWYMKTGLNKKEAIKKVAKDRNVPKSQIYKHSIDL